MNDTPGVDPLASPTPAGGGLRQRLLKRSLGVLLVLLLPTMLALGLIGSGLANPTTPDGIVSFEFCGFSGSCGAALEAWGASGQAIALRSLRLDFLFLLLYSATIAVGLLLVAGSVPPGMRRPTRIAALTCIVMALADAAENLALLQILAGAPAATTGWLASLFAVVKFVILIATVAWLLFTTVVYVLFERGAGRDAG